MNSEYRADIDGLRAIAVLPVVFFHAGFESFRGGYVGVDIFFVISGYLITNVVLQDISKDNFSITKFYERRIRRIFPALFTVLLASLILGWFLLFPAQFKDLGQSVVAASLSASNVLFWLETGYFAAPSEYKPLLHTWSLGVEEQFYLAYPVLLIVICKTLKRDPAIFLVVLLLASFALSSWSVQQYTSATFYLAPTRAWELLLGGLLATNLIPPFSNKGLCRVSSAVGLGLIAYSVFFFTRDTVFPGPSALVPCLGTALIIGAGRGGYVPIKSLLENRLLVFLGLTSYSLYLWHWPLLVYSRLFAIRELTLAETWLVLALSAALAVLSWRFVERPFRGKTAVLDRRSVFVAAGGVTFSALALGLMVNFSNGLPQRVTPSIAAIAAVGAESSPYEERCHNFALEVIVERRLCKIGAENGEPPSFILWGDSHALVLAQKINEIANDFGRSGFLATSNSCPPLVGVTRLERQDLKDCKAINDEVVKLLADEATIDTVVLSARWAKYAEGPGFALSEGSWYLGDSDHSQLDLANNHVVLDRGFERTISQMNLLGKKTYVLLQTPEMRLRVPDSLARSIFYERDLEIAVSLDDFMARNDFVHSVFDKYKGSHRYQLLAPHRLLCENGMCSGTDGAVPLYSDDDHLSAQGAELIRPLLEQIFQ